jgi:ParB/RepB/Spo0J family partition protein
LHLKVSDIFVEDSRQRKNLGDINSLASSIAEAGLINPLLVEEVNGKYNLVAGERRLSAVKALGWEQVPVTIFTALSTSRRELIELHENVKRKDLSWQENVKAVQKYASLRDAQDEAIAKELGLSPTTFSKMLKAAEGLDNLPVCHQCPTWTGAYDLYISHLKKALANDLESFFEEKPLEFPLISNVSENQKTEIPSADKELQKDGVVSGVAQGPFLDGGEVVPVGTKLWQPPAPTVLFKSAPAPKALPKPFEVQEVDFTKWAPEYSGRRFNLIHLDPPYGLSMGLSKMVNSNPALGGKHYEDGGEDSFLAILNALLKNQDRIVMESAHVICWLTPKHYGKAFGKFQYFGWTASEFPLIWHKSDNSGILPDPRRWPRRTYEMALFASRGDRKLVKPKAASFSGPIAKDIHMSEKPRPMLQHFLEMVVDEHTEILDPTAGSANALIVAKQLGASRGLGFDIDKTFVEYGNKELGKT